MKMKQLTIALIAAGFGLALGAGFNRIDTHVLGTANAAVSPPAVVAPVAADGSGAPARFHRTGRSRRTRGRQHQHRRNDQDHGFRR